MWYWQYLHPFWADLCKYKTIKMAIDEKRVTCLTLSLPTGQVYPSYTYCYLFATMSGFYVFWFTTFLWLSKTCDVMDFFSIVYNRVSSLFQITAWCALFIKCTIKIAQTDLGWWEFTIWSFMFQKGGWWRDSSDVVNFCSYFYELLQNIPKIVLGWKYIVLFIGLFALLQKCVDLYTYRGKGGPHTWYNDNWHPDFVNFHYFYILKEKKC